MGSFEAKEEENGVENESGCDAAECVHEEVELRLLEAVLLQPFEHFFFGHQVAAVDGRETATEIDHGRELGDAVFSSVSRVSDFDESYVQIVRFGVNVLQFLQHLLALGAVVLVFVLREKKDSAQLVNANTVEKIMCFAYKSRRRRIRFRPVTCRASFG